jgi:hypothetical protein
MKTIPWQNQGAVATAVSLKQLMSNLVIGSLPVANQNNTCVVNEVRHGIGLGDGMHRAVFVMKDLLAAMVSNSKNGEIYISADRFRDTIVLELQERNNYNGYALSYSIMSIEREAAAFGGHISVTGPQKKVATVTFSFPYKGEAA